jgi:6-pyruvoyltetrahydropterin/6-carboxytetrahydropterin synthase
MYELMVETQFAAAHQLRGYMGKCEKLHGHNWRVQLVINSDKVNEIGLAIDFHELKKMTNEFVSALDHSVLNEIFPFTEINPSSENIARWLYDSMSKKFGNSTIQVSSVTVWESETASATYYE